MKVPDCSVTQFQNLQENSGGMLLLDVREPDEYAQVASPCAKNFPLSTLDVARIIDQLGLSIDDGDDTPLYFICRSGNRSRKAAEQFYAFGYRNVYNIAGGMNHWLELGLPTRKQIP